MQLGRWVGELPLLFDVTPVVAQTLPAMQAGPSVIVNRGCLFVQ
jgi:hypothetical protein